MIRGRLEEERGGQGADLIDRGSTVAVSIANHNINGCDAVNTFYSWRQ